MSESQLKALISQSHTQPLRMFMDDGRAFEISHPDFAFVADEWVILVEPPRHHSSSERLVLLPFSHISGVEVRKRKLKPKAS